MCVQVVFSDTVVSTSGLAAPAERNNAVSPINVGIEDFYKEHKTLNVNMNRNSETSSMNNKINFDSEKYRQTELVRPASTIENLNTGEAGLAGDKKVKRGKCNNLEAGGELGTDTGTKETAPTSSEGRAVL